MTIYNTFVYWIHLSTHTDFLTEGYIGVSNDPDRRLQEHKRAAKSGNNKNPYLGRVMSKHEIKLTILFQGIEDSSYDLEGQFRPARNIGWNIAPGGYRPPSRKGLSHSDETSRKLSISLTDIERTEEWRTNLSKSKQGSKNGMYGKKNVCSDQKRLNILKTKNSPNYETYKKAIVLMNNGLSADKVAIQLNINRGICFKLKNRTHGIFQVFPELIEFFSS